MKMVLLTGASGLVGRYVLRLLLEQDYQVISLGRTPPRQSHPNVQHQWADFSQNVDSILDRLAPVDYVIHCAAHLGFHSSVDHERLQKVNLDFTHSLFSYCQKWKPSSAVFISSYSFLQRPLQEVITELHPISVDSPYGLSKYWGERSLVDLARGHYRGVCLRIPSPIPDTARELPNTVIKKWIDLSQQGKAITVFGSGERTQNFMSTREIAKSVLRAMTDPAAEGIFNLGASESISMNQLATLISSQFGVPVEHTASDSNEERWNISFEKARTLWGYCPPESGSELVKKLIRGNKR